jgi:poly-gamma-glutamate biosynthesis protein PgsC/CapC
MILTAFGIGIALGFLFFEITGLTAGGIIVPGYIALYINQPLRIVITLVISLLTFGLVNFASQFLILFGRRRFLVMILVGFLLRTTFDSLQLYLPETGLDLQAIGYIIPGLIANEFYRQGVWKTVMALIIVSILVYFLLLVWFR